MPLSPRPSSSASPVPAASLILVRERDGLEVLVGSRSLQARAFPGAIVFPGGKLEPQDAAGANAAQDIQLIAARGAVREMFEETGLLICAAGDGPPPGVDVAGARREVEGGERLFADLLSGWDRAFDLERLVPFAHWITPDPAPYRFDTYFFLVAASLYEATAPLICAEFDALGWRRPGDLLRDEPGRLMTPTIHCLASLAASGTVQETIMAAQARGVYDGETARLARRG